MIYILMIRGSCTEFLRLNHHNLLLFPGVVAVKNENYFSILELDVYVF